MFRLIERLQKKPEPVRRGIAFGTALVVTVLIIGVWFSTVGMRFDTESSARVDNAPSPLQSFSQNIDQLFSGFSSDLGQGERESEQAQQAITPTSSSATGTQETADSATTSTTTSSEVSTTTFKNGFNNEP